MRIRKSLANAENNITFYIKLTKLLSTYVIYFEKQNE